MGGVILEVDRVEKSFGRVRAVDGISFAVREGEVFALLGPNGAGKTTLVRMLTGILKPDAGRVVFRLDGAERPPRPAELGYLPEDRGLYGDVPVLRTIAYFGILRGLDRTAAERAARAWLDRLGLTDRAGDKLQTLSKGNQQKVQLAAAMLHRPRFAVLDEPFSGLDPLNQELFLELFRDLRREGTTILLSAHQMALVERLADRALLVGRGRQVVAGTMTELLGNAGAAQRLSVTVRGRPDGDRLARLPGVAEASLGDGARDDGAVRLDFRLDGNGSLSALLAALAAEHEILGVHSERPTLHDVYVRALGGEVPDEAAETEREARA